MDLKSNQAGYMTAAVAQTCPVISVVMPVYRRAYTLAKTIQSILDQTFTDFEFVIVLDGPDPELEGIVRGFDDQRIKLVVSPVNLGVTKALNIGLRGTCGKYFARMDNGDFADPRRLQDQLEALERMGVSVSFCQAIIVEPDGTLIEATQPQSWIFRLWMSMFCQSLGTAGSALFADAELLKSIGGFDEAFRYAQDYEISERLANLGQAFAYTEKMGLLIPMYEDGITKQKQAAQEGFSRQVMARATRRYMPEITDSELSGLAIWRDRYKFEGENSPFQGLKVIKRLGGAFAKNHGLKHLPFEICEDIAQFTELNLRVLNKHERVVAFKVLLWTAFEARSFKLLKYFGGTLRRFYITKEPVGHSSEKGQG